MFRKITVAATLIASLCCLTNQSHAATYELTQTLFDPLYDGIDNGPYGSITALDGNTALINSGSDSVPSIYAFNTNTGAIINTFVEPSTPNPLAGFDIGAIAIDGSQTLIGSYLFDTATGNLQQVFEAPTSQARFDFAGSVALNGDKVLIGVRPAILAGPNSNEAVYLFDRSTGELLQTFLNPSTDMSGNFGGGIALNENYALVSAPEKISGGSEHGAAYLFDINSGALLQSFTNPDPDLSLANIVPSVALSEDAALVGNALFDLNSGELLQTFTLPTLTPGVSLTPASVALSNDEVLIGAAGRNGSNLETAAFLFDINTGNVVETFLVPPSDQIANSGFGFRVELDEDSILISSPDILGTGKQGAVFLFQETQSKSSSPSSQSVPEPGLLIGLVTAAGLGLKQNRKCGD